MPPSSRVPADAAGEAPFAGHDEGQPCLASVPKNRQRERLYRVLNHEMAIWDHRPRS